MKTLAHMLGRWTWLAASLLALAAQAAAPSRWTITDLGDLGNLGGYVSGLNNRGDVIGNSFVPAIHGEFHVQESHATLWQNGILQDLSTPQFRAFGAVAINDRGTVVLNGGGVNYLWNDGAYTTLPFFGDVHSINRSGHLAGMRWNGTQYVAFVWRDGSLFHLGNFGGTMSGATAMNDKGLVVGFAETPLSGQIHAFAWDNGPLIDLGTLGGEDSMATSVNSHGAIVGYSQDVNGEYAAFIVEPRGSGMRRLMDYAPSHFAASINDRGAVVGTIGRFAPNLSGHKSYLYDDGTLTILEDIPEVRAAGWTQLMPVKINDRGWIAGYGFRPGFPGALRPFLLQPR
jgi:probable HAF family extracellular repeat protein